MAMLSKTEVSAIYDNSGIVHLVVIEGDFE